MLNEQYFREQGAKGGRKAAKRLGKSGLSERAKRGWKTRKSNGKPARGK
jgi:hypothetical protein